MNGFHGRYIDIDVGRGSIKELPISEKFYKKFIGGSTAAAALIFDRIPQGMSPQSTESPLVFATGPFTGTSIPMVGRYAVAGISPSTGYWGEATSGGKFPFRLKGTGFDGLIVAGKADHPVYIHLKNGNAEIKDATHLWGKDTYATQEALKSELGGKISIACIGKAGEQQIGYACVMNDEGRAAGRCGLGALMGSKNLKAVVCEGNMKTGVASKETLTQMNKQTIPAVKGNMIGMALHEFGTAMYTLAGMSLGDVPTKYFTKSVFPAEKIDGMAMKNKYKIKGYACQNCVIGCGRTLTDVAPDLPKVDGPEYETTASFGPLCENYDLDVIVRANHLCNQHGLDTISAGVCIAYGMYLFEKGVIDEAKIGLELKWGDGTAILKMLEMIIAKEGFGEIMGKGTLAMARELGRDEGEAAQVKGLEIPMHDPRAFAGCAISYAVSPRGACHLRGDYLLLDVGIPVEEYGLLPGDRFATDKAKVETAAKLQAYKELFDALAMCKMCLAPPSLICGYLNAVTGWEVTPDSLLQTGMRSLAIKRAVSNKMGLDASLDTLPAIVNTPLTEGSTAGRTLPIENMVKDYYDFMGWDLSTGRPGKEQLAILGLDNVVNAFYE